MTNENTGKNGIEKRRFLPHTVSIDAPLFTVAEPPHVARELTREELKQFFRKSKRKNEEKQSGSSKKKKT